MPDEAREETSATRREPDHPLPPPHRSGAVRAIVWLLILSGFGVLFWAILHQHPPATAGPGARRGFAGPVAVSVETAVRGDIGVYLDAIGTVTPVYTDTITSEVTGLLTQVEYQEGQYVHRGQPLVEIDPRPYQGQLVAAQGALQRDINVLAEAKMDLDRYRAAWARNAIPKQQLDDQEKLVLQDEGTVTSDQGTVQFDQVQVEFCHITSPIEGRVGLRLVDPGNVVIANSTTPLAVVAQISPITVVFVIPEDSVPQVQAQMSTGVSLPVIALDRGDQRQLAVGRLQTMDNQIDTTTGTLKLRAIFANTDRALYPNQFVNARLLLQTLRVVTLIPSSAIQHNGAQSFVYLIRNGVAKQTNVTVGVNESGRSEVTGIQPGDVVANSSFEKLVDGSQVQLAKSLLPPSTGESSAP